MTLRCKLVFGFIPVLAIGYGVRGTTCSSETPVVGPDEVLPKGGCGLLQLDKSKGAPPAYTDTLKEQGAPPAAPSAAAVAAEADEAFEAAQAAVASQAAAAAPAADASAAAEAADESSKDSSSTGAVIRVPLDSELQAAAGKVTAVAPRATQLVQPGGADKAGAQPEQELTNTGKPIEKKSGVEDSAGQDPEELSELLVKAKQEQEKQEYKFFSMERPEMA